MTDLTPNVDPRAVLAARLATVEARLEAACRRAGRTRSDVTLVAVTKTVGVEVAALLPELGVRDLGENRPQELWHKAAILAPPHPTLSPLGGERRVRGVRWNLIGPLQRNKVDRTVPLVSLIHSVHSARLLHELATTKAHGPLPLLL